MGKTVRKRVYAAVVSAACVVSCLWYAKAEETIEEQIETEPVDSDVDSGYPDTDDEAELARREAEAELRKRTAAANNKELRGL